MLRATKPADEQMDDAAGDEVGGDGGGRPRGRDGAMGRSSDSERTSGAGGREPLQDEGQEQAEAKLPEMLVQNVAHGKLSLATWMIWATP